MNILTQLVANTPWHTVPDDQVKNILLKLKFVAENFENLSLQVFDQKPEVIKTQQTEEVFAVLESTELICDKCNDGPLHFKVPSRDNVSFLTFECQKCGLKDKMDVTAEQIAELRTKSAIIKAVKEPTSPRGGTEAKTLDKPTKGKNEKTPSKPRDLSDFAFVAGNSDTKFPNTNPTNSQQGQSNSSLINQVSGGYCPTKPLTNSQQGQVNNPLTQALSELETELNSAKPIQTEKCDNFAPISPSKPETSTVNIKEIAQEVVSWVPNPVDLGTAESEMVLMFEGIEDAKLIDKFEKIIGQKYTSSTSMQEVKKQLVRATLQGCVGA